MHKRLGGTVLGCKAVSLVQGTTILHKGIVMVQGGTQRLSAGATGSCNTDACEQEDVIVQKGIARDTRDSTCRYRMAG